MSNLRDLPSIDSLLADCRRSGLVERYGHDLTVDALRETLARIRDQHNGSDQAPVPERAALLKSTELTLEAWLTPSLRTVINASGVILHTNLGRAPLSHEARQALTSIASAYNTLEYDLPGGSRGSRSSHARDLLCRLTGAEDALVVNNNAAAVLLVLTTLARRRKVVISRTQLVEIGGGFRIPEVLAQSGARLVEVGTTNRVALADYESALEQNPAAILHAHQSNFKIVGFTAEPGLAELASLAHRQGIPLIDDNGSGALLDTARYGLAHEPTVQESLSAGSDLVCFSGDKLLGGPQAGIILGRADLLARLSRHPLLRAVRADKLCLAALSQTLLHYLKGEAEGKVPVWKMISTNPAGLRKRALAWKKALGVGEVTEGLSTVGGGSLPGETLPTHLLCIPGVEPQALLARLRGQSTPVIARIDRDAVVLDPRTVFEEQEAVLLETLQHALA